MGQVEKGLWCLEEINEEANGGWVQLEYRNYQHGSRVVEEDNKGQFYLLCYVHFYFCNLEIFLILDVLICFRKLVVLASSRRSLSKMKTT